MSSTKVLKESASASRHRPFVTDDAFTAYEHFKPLALALPPERVKRRTCGADVARANVATAMAMLRPIAEAVRAAYPSCPVDDLLEEPALALAFGYAAGRVAPPPATAKALLREYRPLRKRGLQALEVLAAAGAVPAERVSAIRAGRGVLDSVHDGIAIAAVFREYHAEIAGRHPLSQALIDEIEARANQLVRQLRPASARRPPVALDAARDLRDRLFTLLAERHEWLRRVAAVHFGLDQVTRLVPDLGVRARHPKAAPAVAAPPTAPHASTSLPAADLVASGVVAAPSGAALGAAEVSAVTERVAA